MTCYSFVTCYLCTVFYLIRTSRMPLRSHVVPRRTWKGKKHLLVAIRSGLSHAFIYMFAQKWYCFILWLFLYWLLLFGNYIINELYYFGIYVLSSFFSTNVRYLLWKTIYPQFKFMYQMLWSSVFWKF